MGNRTPRAAALASVVGAVIVIFGGPSWFVVGLPLALTGVLLGLQSLALRRTAVALAACLIGLLALVVPVAQFALQS